MRMWLQPDSLALSEAQPLRQSQKHASPTRYGSAKVARPLPPFSEFHALDAPSQFVFASELARVGTEIGNH